MTGVRARGLAASKPRSVQRAGRRGAMPAPAYEDLASALHSPVKDARAASRAVCWTLGDGRRSAVRIMKCVNCFFSCREAVRNWLCRSVLMRGSSQRNVNVLFRLNISMFHVVVLRITDELVSRV